MFKNWLKKKEEPQTEVEETSEAAQAPAVEEQAEEPARKGFLKDAWEATKKLALTPVDPWFEKMAEGLDRTRRNLVGQVVSLFTLHKRIDEEFWEELEDVLITSDVGASATQRIVDELRGIVKEKKLSEPEQLLGELRQVLGGILDTGEEVDRALNIVPGRVNVILLVGVNGSGKTTSTGKIAHYLKQQGHSVMLAAADTFRAAAIEQLEHWADRLDVQMIKHKEGADPAAVVFDAVSAARAREVDVLLIDTAGRLHSKVNLMEELKKIRRIASRELEGAPHDVLLVLDATSGQNALSQAKQFTQAVDVTGLVLCKLDGTAKGGIVVAIAQEHSIPVKFIGVGEGADDLRPFEPDDFLRALFGEKQTLEEEATE